MKKTIMVAVLWVSGDEAASISRPVRDASELGKALDWQPNSYYGDSIDPPKERVAYHERPQAEEHHLHLKGDATLHPMHALGGGNAQCPLELELLWSTQLGGPVSSTPIARRSMFADGGVQLVVPTFVRYLELIEGDEGLAPVGWPLAFDVEDPEEEEGGGGDDDDEGQGDDELSTTDRKNKKSGAGGGDMHRDHHLGPSLFHGGAMVHDVNGDGRDDVGVVDGDGNVYWVAVGSFGEYLHDYRVSVPKLRVRRDWYDGLDLDFTDSYVELSMFHHDNQGEDNGDGTASSGEDTGDDFKGRQRIVNAMSGNGGGSSSSGRVQEKIGQDSNQYQIDDDVLPSGTYNPGGGRPLTRRAKQADTLVAHAALGGGGVEGLQVAAVVKGARTVGGGGCSLLPPTMVDRRDYLQD
jgi:hypothetical protein